MMIGNIEIVTFLVIILFLGPIMWNIYNKFLEKITFIGLIKTFNKSLKIQGISIIYLIPISWILNKFNLIFGTIIGETTYTYIVIGIFMYLPSLAFLNLVKLIIESRLEK